MRGLLRSTLLLGLLGSALCQEDHDGHDHDKEADDHDGHDDEEAVDHDGHDHGGGGAAWEWSGVFPFEAEEHTIMLQKVDGAYADGTIKFSYHKASSGDAAGIEALEEATTELWEGDALDVEGANTGTLQPDVLYNVHLDESAMATFLRIPAPATAGPVAIFMQHFPIEFEESAHYLVDAHGHDVEPLAEGAGHEEVEVSFVGHAIAANLAVSLVSLTGIGVLMPWPCWSKGNFSIRRFMVYTSAFASGTLLAAAFFLILPEALLNIRGGSEAYNAFVFGAASLAGFALGAILHWGLRMLYANGGEAVEPASETVDPAAAALTDIEGQGEQKTAAPKEKTMAEFQADAGGLCEFKKWAGVAYSVLIGDFFHNIVDGVAISVAFKLCNPAIGWVVAMGAVAHELPTELSDYMVLVTQGRMKPSAALFWNLMSGLSCLAAGIVAAYVDMAEETTGGLLAFSAGVYIWVSCEVFPMALKTKTCAETMIALSLLFLGFILVGLVLLVHEHCAAGHNH